MNNTDLNNIVSELIKPESYEQVYHKTNRHMAMPSLQELEKIVVLLKSILFPGYFDTSEITPETMIYFLGANIDKVASLLIDQIKKGFCFCCEDGQESACARCEEIALENTHIFLKKLPKLRQMLAQDVEAAYVGDPATNNRGEIIFCYPSIRALTHHRIAHELFIQDVPLIPRIISEMAHSKTGIDIHPGATISEGLFIDHGTGTVIGDTCIIGKNVRIYQGITLGAKSFPLDSDGNPIKGIPRHPIVEDDVIIYSGTTILGRITIGQGAVIGGNMWVTDDVPRGSKILVCP